MNYNHSRCVDNNLSADSILEHYANERKLVRDLCRTTPDALVKTLWSSTSPWSRDIHCRCAVGSKAVRTHYQCPQCKHLGRLIHYKRGGVNKPFLIECGVHRGLALVVENKSVTKLFLTVDIQLAARLQVASKILHQEFNGVHPNRYVNSNVGITQDNSVQSSALILRGDDFTIAALLGINLEEYFHDMGLPHVPRTFTSFVCGNHGYVVRDASVANLNGLLNSTMWVKQDGVSSQASNKGFKTPARDLLNQLAVFLREAGKLDFTCGTPLASSLGFNPLPVSYAHDGRHIVASFTLAWCNLTGCAATFPCGSNFFRLLPSTSITDNYLSHLLQPPDIIQRNFNNVLVGPEYSGRNIVNPIEGEGNSTWFKLDADNLNTYYHLQSAMGPVLRARTSLGRQILDDKSPSTLDTYYLFCSLMSYPSFRSMVNSDSVCRRAWSYLWRDQDIVVKVETELNEVSSAKPASMKDIGLILGKHWLRLNPKLWENLSDD